jgi:hypothetical protein
LHAVVADVFFDRKGNHDALEQLFRACMLRGRAHSGFPVFKKYKSIEVSASRRMSVKI